MFLGERTSLRSCAGGAWRSRLTSPCAVKRGGVIVCGKTGGVRWYAATFHPTTQGASAPILIEMGWKVAVYQASELCGRTGRVGRPHGCAIPYTEETIKFRGDNCCIARTKAFDQPIFRLGLRSKLARNPPVWLDGRSLRTNLRSSAGEQGASRGPEPSSSYHLLS